MTTLVDSRRARPVLVLVFLGAVILLAVCFRAALLRAMAQFLVVPEKPVASDVIIALGGGEGHREVEAARLYTAGMGRRLILTGGTRMLPGLNSTWADLMARQISGRVPDSALVLERRSTSTFEDAAYTLEDLRALGARSVIVVTDPYHLRRARATFRHVYRGSGIALRFTCPANSWFKADGWWKEEDSMLVVIVEYLKMFFYLYHYHITPWS